MKPSLPKVQGIPLSIVLAVLILVLLSLVRFFSFSAEEVLSFFSGPPHDLFWPEPRASTPGYALALSLLVAIGGWLASKKMRQPILRPQSPYFQLLLPGELPQIIVLENQVYTLDFLSSVSTKTPLRLSSNLNKVTLSPWENSFLLEDKNYKNALLINRRRIRRVFLQEGDLLDIGEWMLLYRNPSELKGGLLVPGDALFDVKYEKPRGPLRKGISLLVNEQSRQEFPLTYNLISIGSSEDNDLVLKGKMYL